MDVKDNPESFLEAPVDNGFDTVHPGCVYRVWECVRYNIWVWEMKLRTVWSLGGKVVRPGHWDTDTFETCSLDLVKGGFNNRGVIPAAFVRNSIKGISKL